jgi:hypothetical protein
MSNVRRSIMLLMGVEKSWGGLLDIASNLAGFAVGQVRDKIPGGRIFLPNRGEYLGKAKATTPDLLVETASTSITSLKFARLLRHRGQLYKAIFGTADKNNIPTALSNLTKEKEFSRISRVFDYPKVSETGLGDALFQKISDYNNRYFELAKRFSARRVDEVSTLFDRTKAFVRGFSPVKAARMYINEGVKLGHNLFDKLKGFGDRVLGNPFIQKAAQHKLTKRVLKLSSRIIDAVEYGIAGYEVASGFSKLSGLNSLSTREQYQYAYEQIGSGVGRAIGTFGGSLVAKPLYAMGAGLLAGVVTAPIGLLVIGLGLGFDVFGSELGAWAGGMLGRATGTGAYYMQNAGRFKRDLGGWFDKIMGRTSKTRDKEDEWITWNLSQADKAEAEKPKDERKWMSRLNLIFKGFTSFINKLNPFMFVPTELYNRYTRSKDEQRRRQAEPVEQGVPSSNETSTSSATTAEPTTPRPGPPRQERRTKASSAPVKGTMRVAVVTTTRPQPDVHPLKDNPLAQVRAFFDQSRNTIVLDRKDEDDAYQVSVNSPGGATLDVAEVRV